MKFNEKLTILRKKSGLSQEGLADKLGVSRQAISRWELGATMPDAANLLQLSNLFGVSVDYLLHDGDACNAYAPNVQEADAKDEAMPEAKEKAPAATEGEAKAEKKKKEKSTRKKGPSTALLICLMAAVLILPIGVGAVSGLAVSNPAADVEQSQEPETALNLALSESEVAFNIGATRDLTASMADETGSYIFQWSTNDKSIVSVKKDAELQKSCRLTAEGKGSATVTLSIIDLKQFKIVDSVSCQVTVNDDKISFDVEEVVISLDKGNTATVTATAPNGGQITWSTEDASVATVEGGVITAHKAGQVSLIAKSGNIEGRLPVKIYNSLFTLEELKVVCVGASEQIAVDGTINGKAVWASGDDRIVTVDENGVVTGVKTGMTTVTATSEEDGLTATSVIIVKSGSDQAIELAEGKKAVAAENPGNWFFLCESDIVTVSAIPTYDNGLIYADITGIGESGANFFYLRYQPDEIGDVIYKNTNYIYSSTDNALVQINGKDYYLKAGLNRIELEFTSAAPKDGNPYQFKWKAMGRFYIMPVFEEISRIEKMTLSAESALLNASTNKSITLTATVPGQESPVIEWISSNEKVATVSGGTVTAVGEGSSMITAVCGNFSATCLVTVEGATPIEGDELSSGNKAAALAAPGEWFYLKDGKSALYSKPIIDSDGNIHLGIEKVDEANKKYVYLRYQPETLTAYKATITIEFAGADGTVVDISGGNVGATPTALHNGVNNIEFTFTGDDSTPLQFKFYSVGSYVINVTLSEE